MNINEITYREIKSLSDVGLSDLLLTLLNSESQTFKFKGIREIIVPLRINVGDAGDDGRVNCDDTNGSTYVTNAKSLFQCKATDLSPQEIFDEFFAVNVREVAAIPPSGKKKGKPAVPKQLELKDKIKDVLDADGQYVFFISHDYNSLLLGRRIQAAKRALTEYNKLHGTTYTSDQVRVMEGNEIAGWTNKYINAVTKVQGRNQIYRPDGLKALDELNDFLSIKDITFHSNERIKNHIDAIQESVSKEKSTLRIIGHSGLGKTRLVYEALKASNQIDQAAYFDIVTDGQNIVNFVRTYGKSLTGIVIVDNCEYHYHKLLKDEITRQGSTFRLITIDYNVSEEFDKSKTNADNYIFLHNRNLLDIVRKILEDQFGGRLDRTHIDQIAEYSEGYPGMAVLFATARLDGMDDLSELLGDDNIERLAFGRDWIKKDEVKFDILKACSIFSHFSRPLPSSISLLTEEEKKLFTDQRDLIINKICDPERSKRNFSESTSYFEDRRVMERRGNFLSVKPTPLAVKLAMNWWKHYDQSELLVLFPLLEELNMAIPLVNRLSELDQLSEAKEVVNELLREQSPFGSAEVLNTPLGSHLFRSIASVNSEASIAAIERTFGQMEIQVLKDEVGPGRRYIIWALEMLAFRKDYFSRATAQLFRFAAAENENISNNATGQLLQLFHIVLAGTEADLVQRLEVIDLHLSNENPNIRHLAVLAMCRGLKGDSFRRDIGAEKQGSGAYLVDFQPTWAQSAQYWHDILDRMIKIAKEDESERELIKDTISRSFRTLFHARLEPLVDKAVSKILEYDTSYWENAINQLKASLQYEDLDDQDKRTISKLLAMLQPNSLEDQIKFYVSFPSWDFNYNKEEDYVDHTELETEKFAERIVASGINLHEVFPHILSGEQRKGFAFGKKLGELTQDPGLLNEMLNKISEVSTGQQNPDAIAGYLSTLPKDQRAEILSRIIENESIARHSFYLTRVQQPDLTDLMNLFKTIDQGKADIQQFYQFTYGRGLDALTPIGVLDVFTKIAQYPDGQIIALELTQQYIGNNEDLWHDLKPFLKNLIAENNMLLNHSGSHAKYSWSRIVEKLLIEKDSDLMKSITLQIKETAHKDRLSSIDHYLKRIVQKIMVEEFEMFWEIVGPELMNNSTYLSFKFLLGSNNGERASPGLLEYSKYNVLLNWSKENAPLAPKRIGYMMPITIRENARMWHPLAQIMIDEFGTTPGFLKEVSANIHSFSSVGSQIPYLEDQQAIFEQMLKHPLAEVRVWAIKEVKGMKERIARTTLDEPSEFLDY